ncbi:MAG: Ig domain-containing protein [Labilibaculum antarcticum]
MKSKLICVASLIFLFATSCDKETVKPESITITDSKIELNVGKSDTLEYIVNPTQAEDYSVSWTSEDENVAEVLQNGIIEAKKIGSTKIIISTSNNKTAFCMVTVVATTIKEVTLSESNINLKLGEASTLKYKISPEDATDKSVSWKSSDLNIATITDGGVVKAIAPGKATITVTTNDGSFTATCEVTVDPVLVSSIEISQTDLMIFIGESTELSAIVYPDNATDKSVLWESSDINIATITDEGVVKALGIGEAEIKVTSNDGDFSAICKIEVKPILVSGIVVTSTTQRFNIGEEFELKAVVYPENATYRNIDWSSDNIDVATISDAGIITTKAQGSATISAISDDGLVKEEYYIEVGYKMIVTVVNIDGETIGDCNVVAWDTDVEVNISTSPITGGRFEIFSNKERIVNILVASASYNGVIIYDTSINENKLVNVKLTDNTHSSIISTSEICYIPGLTGRLNPVCDNLGRTYLYADNISINDETLQPVDFNSTDSLKLEDAYGVIMYVWIPFIHDSVFLLNYKKNE